MMRKNFSRQLQNLYEEQGKNDEAKAGIIKIIEMKKVVIDDKLNKENPSPVDKETKADLKLMTKKKTAGETIGDVGDRGFKDKFNELKKGVIHTKSLFFQFSDKNKHIVSDNLTNLDESVNFNYKLFMFPILLTVYSEE